MRGCCTVSTKPPCFVKTCTLPRMHVSSIVSYHCSLNVSQKNSTSQHLSSIGHLLKQSNLLKERIFLKIQQEANVVSNNTQSFPEQTSLDIRTHTHITGIKVWKKYLIMKLPTCFVLFSAIEKITAKISTNRMWRKIIMQVACGRISCCQSRTSIFNGEVVGAYLSTTLPSLSTRNLVKFHLIPFPKNPPFFDFKNL